MWHLCCLKLWLILWIILVILPTLPLMSQCGMKSHLTFSMLGSHFPLRSRNQIPKQYPVVFFLPEASIPSTHVHTSMEFQVSSHGPKPCMPMELVSKRSIFVSPECTSEMLPARLFNTTWLSLSSQQWQLCCASLCWLSFLLGFILPLPFFWLERLFSKWTTWTRAMILGSSCWISESSEWNTVLSALGLVLLL